MLRMERQWSLDFLTLNGAYHHIFISKTGLNEGENCMENDSKLHPVMPWIQYFHEHHYIECAHKYTQTHQRTHTHSMGKRCQAETVPWAKDNKKPWPVQLRQTAGMKTNFITPLNQKWSVRFLWNYDADFFPFVCSFFNRWTFSQSNQYKFFQSFLLIFHIKSITIILLMLKTCCNCYFSTNCLFQEKFGDRANGSRWSKSH